MVPRRHRTAALVDLLNLMLGMVLFLGPWVFGFVSDIASENAWVSGALIGLVATAAIIASDAREERINLIVGLWVAGSPWLLGFHAEMHIHFVVGLMVAALATIELWLTHRAEERDAAVELAAKDSVLPLDAGPGAIESLRHARALSRASTSLRQKA